MLESLAATGIGMRIARGVARALPQAAAGPVVRTIARRLSADPGSPLMRAVRVNQWVVSGRSLSGGALDDAVAANIDEMARLLYDFYHALGNATAERRLVAIDDVFAGVVERERTDGPFVYVGAHFGNFDLVGRMLGLHGWRMQVLSVADPNEGYRWQNDVREEAGFEVTPVTVEALKHAARGLAEGRSVLSGLDRPLLRPDKAQPLFFGHPSPLPLLHVRLAMRAQVPVIVLGAPRGDDGRYRLAASDPIEMEGDTLTAEAMRANAERCLAIVERWVRERPAQWAMPHSAWPDLPVPG